MGTAQEEFLTALHVFGDVAKEVDLSAGIAATAVEYEIRIRDFRVVVPVVGSFNAGKTSLINAYLRREDGLGLPTDIVPQTALATELHPAKDGEHERIELFGPDSRLLQQVALAAFGRFEKDAVATGRSDIHFAKAILCCEVLTLDRQRILVDMPGLDSGLRNHNAAIQRYLPLGSYFILVVDIEHGALRESEALQLREFFDQEVEFTVLVNKSDKKKVDREAIMGHIKEQVRHAFGKSAPVWAVSARDGDIGAFKDTIESVDFQRALRSFWRLRLVSLFDEAIRSLHTRYSAINVSSSESERAIQELEHGQTVLEEKLREDEREIRDRYSDRAVNRILREVRNEIHDQADALASSYETGGNSAFQGTINQLVRSTLNRTLDRERSETQREIVERYQTNIEHLDARFERFVADGADASEFRGNVEHFSATALDAARRSSRAFSEAAAGLSKRQGSTVYATIGGVLAATTNIVAPWIEVVVLLLPYIVSLFGESKEEKRQHRMHEQHEQLREQVANTIAPRIASELRQRIADDYEKIVGEMLSDLRNSVKGQVESIQADIRKSRAEIDSDRKDAEARKLQLAEAVTQLTDAKRRIESV